MEPNTDAIETLVDRREYLRLTGALAAGATAGLAGCASSIPGTGSEDSNGGSGSSTGLLSTAVSDDPGDIGDFESCIVTLDGIWVGPKTDGESDDEAEDGDTDGEDSAESDDETEDAESETEQDDGNGPPEQAGGDASSSSDDTASGSQSNETDGTNETDVDDNGDGAGGNESDATDGSEDGDGDDEDDDSGGRTYYEFDEPQEADLTQLQGDAQQLVGEHELEVGTYQFLQLDIGGISGTLTDGSEAAVDTPGNAPLKFNQSFDVREGYRTTFLADFTPVKRGNGSYLFKPVATETEVNYQEIESDDSTTDDGNATDGSGNTTVDGGNTTGDSGNTSGGNETST